MKPKTMTVAVAIALTLMSLTARAAAVPESRSPNAALRYWMAFAMMQDFSAESDTNRLLQEVAAGSAAWDDRLNPILDRNELAIRAMQRATRLQRCDWQLEYELGPATPIYHLSRARVLARLNVLYGVRAAARGDNAGAVEAWTAGVRFAVHLAQDESLFGMLTAKAALDADLRAIIRASPTLDSQSKAQLAKQLMTLPPYAFDWASAMRREADAGTVALKDMLKSSSRAELYQEWFGEPMPAGTSIAPQDLPAYRTFMDAVETAFGLPYEQTKDRLPKFDEQKAKLNPVVRRLLFSLNNVNESRRELAEQRQAALNALRN